MLCGESPHPVARWRLWHRCPVNRPDHPPESRGRRFSHDSLLTWSSQISLPAARGGLLNTTQTPLSLPRKFYVLPQGFHDGRSGKLIASRRAVKTNIETWAAMCPALLDSLFSQFEWSHTFRPNTAVFALPVAAQRVNLLAQFAPPVCVAFLFQLFFQPLFLFALAFEASGYPVRPLRNWALVANRSVTATAELKFNMLLFLPGPWWSSCFHLPWLRSRTV
jgi:hypothetical protein